MAVVGSDREAAPSVFARHGTGVGVGLATNAVVLASLLLILYDGEGGRYLPVPVPVPLAVRNAALYAVVLFSAFQLVYLGPPTLVLSRFAFTRPLATGLLTAAAVTFLLNGMCVGGGTILTVWSLSTSGVH